MKQVLQNLRTGKTEVADVPSPTVTPGTVLIRTTRTLLSVGTERMLVSFGQASLLGKARAQPEKVRQVVDKIRTDGLITTVESVFAKLEQPLALGYCNVGIVLDVGDDVSGFAPGDRVVSNGRHAEVVSVSKNLCAKIPDGVSDDAAAFTVLAAIGLQGIRLVSPTLGEAVVVTGLGLIGLCTVQLLRAHGCRVLGIDYDSSKLDVAKDLGAEVVDLSAGQDPISAAAAFSRGRGVDAVVITASTDSNEPVHQAATMCRKRGRIVLVGVSGLQLARADFYEKELSFQVSCSYGPGRYDPLYEEKGIDYPVGFVRWTEQRNFEAVLDMLADQKLDVDRLISHRFPIKDAARAYELVTGAVTSLGILLEYPRAAELPDSIIRRRTVSLTEAPQRLPLAASNSIRAPSLGVVGSGNYATAVLIPALKAAGAQLSVVVSSAGVSGVHAGRKFGFNATTTDADSVFADPAIDGIVIATRHDTHAAMVQKALSAGKHVFVEKPLALSSEELESIQKVTASRPDRILMVGFNRRFAPQVQRIRGLLATISEPRVFLMTVNAGAIPRSHWTQDPKSGGGRIIGEACHFIDLLRYLAGSSILKFRATSMGNTAGLAATEDKATITIEFADGSIGTLLYLANGHKSFPKERLEVFSGGRVLQLDNFRRLSGFGWPGFKSMNLWRQDKGQKECAASFVQAIQTGGPSPIPIGDLMEVSKITIEIAAALRQETRSTS